MLWGGEELFTGGLLDQFAVGHNPDAVGVLGHDAHVVRNKEHGRAELGLQVAHEFEDLGLDRDIQGGGRLVRDQDFGSAGQGHGDHDALAHATGELVGKLAHTLIGCCDADMIKHLDGRTQRLVSTQALMQSQDLYELVANREDRVEGGHGFLKDHGDIVTANAAHLDGG